MNAATATRYDLASGKTASGHREVLSYINLTDRVHEVRTHYVRRKYWKLIPLRNRAK